MIRKLMFLLLIAIIVLLQSSVLPFFIAQPFKPDLLLILMVFVALRFSLEQGALLAWGLGLLKDTFGGLYMGLHAFIFLILFLGIKSCSDRLYAESGELFVFSVSMASVASVVISMILSILFTSNPAVAYSMLLALIPHTIMNAFCASLVTLLPLFSSPVQENV